MARDLTVLTLQMSADIRRFEKQLQQMNDVTNRRLNQIERSVRQSSPRLSRAMEQAGQEATRGLRDGLSGVAGVFAAAVSVQQVSNLADSYTRFTNQLKVAGLEGGNLANVQEQLFTTAQKYGTQLESLGALYGRTSQGAAELGASQADLIRFTEGVAAAVKVTGGTEESSRGAILQLTQALGGAVVRAEEFNSINEGARPILQAVADNIDKYGGSVAKLRADVINGKLASKDFFQALLAGTDELVAKAQSANLTISGSFQVLNNALAKYIGEADSSLSATQKFAQAIGVIADNLDTIMPALVAITAMIGVKFAAGMLTATAATVRQTLATASATVATNAYNATLVRHVGMLNAQASAAAASTLATAGLGGAARITGTALLGAFGGPVGLAVTALTLGLGYMAFETSKAEAQAKTLSAEINSTAKALEEERIAAEIAAQEQGKLKTELGKAEIATADMTGETHLLADAHYRAANAIKAQRLEAAQLKADTARTTAEEARKLAEKTKDRAIVNASAPVSPMGLPNPTAMASRAGAASRAADVSKEAKDAATAQANADTLQAQVEAIRKQKLGEFLPQTPPKPQGGGAGKGSKATAADPNAELTGVLQSLETGDERARREANNKIAVLSKAFKDGRLEADAYAEAVKRVRAEMNDAMFGDLVLKPDVGVSDMLTREIQDFDPAAYVEDLKVKMSPAEMVFNDIADAAEYAFGRARGNMQDFASYFTDALAQMASAWAAAQAAGFLFGTEDKNGDRSGGLLSGLFDGKKSPSYAVGTQNHPGGLAYVHKNEMVSMPKGSKVFTASQTRSMLGKVGTARAQAMNVSLHSTYSIEGAVSEQALRRSIAASQEQGVSRSVAAMRKMFPGLNARLSQLGTV